MTITTEVTRHDIKRLNYLIGKAEKRLQLISNPADKEKCINEIKTLKTAINALSEIQEIKMANKKKYTPEAQRAIQLLRVRINKIESYKAAEPKARIWKDRLNKMYEVKKYIEANKNKVLYISDFPEINFNVKKAKN